jgi:2,5-diketo-D-gluconate reductase A
VGRALRDSGVPRDEVFITTKCYPGRKDPAAEAQQSLRRLGVDQVNLYLVHWPQAGPPGHGREWSGLASVDSPVPSAYRTSARAS